MELFDIARRVRKGAQLLDKKFGPGWRKVLQKYESEFNLKNGDHCVLGTLEHHYGKMQALRLKGSLDPGESGVFFTALNRLRIEELDKEYGFSLKSVWYKEETWEQQVARERMEWDVMSDLWRAEFGASQ